MESGAGGDWDSPTLARIGVPEGVREVIGRRLARLGDDATRSLPLAAVIGREFELGLLQDLMGDIEPEPLLEALDEATAAGIIREEPGSPGRYSFTHALIRDTIYAELAGARRPLLHRRVADALARRTADRPPRWGELAHHLLQAAEPDQMDRAAEYAVKAAQQALGQLA
jgi:predicted ATPase